MTTSSFEVAALAPFPAVALRSAGPVPDPASQAFARDAQATIATMEVELAGAALRPDDPLFGSVERLAAAVNKMLQLAGTRGQPAAGPAARTVTPFEQATKDAQAATAQIQTAAGAAPRGLGQLMLALQDKMRADILRLQQVVKPTINSVIEQ